MTLKIKEKQFFGRNCILDNVITRKLNKMGSFVAKGSGSGIFPEPDPKPGDPKRPDPTGSGSESATLVLGAGVLRIVTGMKCFIL